MQIKRNIFFRYVYSITILIKIRYSHFFILFFRNVFMHARKERNAQLTNVK
jgi:hypothetical protein